MEVRSAITVNAPPDAVYSAGRDLTRLPTFMHHLEAATPIDDRRSHWTAKGPAGTKGEWDAEVTDDDPGERIAWRSLAGASAQNSGQVRFKPAPGGRGTEVHAQLQYRPP